MIRPDDVDRSLEALSGAGMRPERPPEEWLVKAWDGDTLVDLIYCPKGPLLVGLEILPEVTLHRSGTTVRVVSPQRSPATQGG